MSLSRDAPHTLAAVTTLARTLATSAKIIAQVIQGASLANSETTLDGAVRDTVYGTLRAYGVIPALFDNLSTRPKTHVLIRALIYAALYALQSERHAKYTVVDQAVRACTLLRQPAAGGFVNAILRTYLRQQNSPSEQPTPNAQVAAQHPQWWIDLLRASYPTQASNILSAGNTAGPMDVRINTRRISRDAWLNQAAQQGVSAQPVGECGARLQQAVPMQALPGFAQGEVSVQDAGAQYAAALLQLQSGQRVLDACAAPGGKTGHLLESAQITLTALDISAKRCERIEQNLQRLGLTAQVCVGDVLQPDTWWDGQKFDRILADVPCSGSGVVRRHPDIKWLRRLGDIDGFAQQQLRILESLWQMLLPGGKLLYVTCSVFEQENSHVIKEFLRRTPAATPDPSTGEYGQQLMPGPDHDGFFYAGLNKRDAQA